jgi:putative dimethyl sulfoxide reductase chaperone
MTGQATMSRLPPICHEEDVVNQTVAGAGLAGDWTETLTGAMLLFELTGKALYVYPEKPWFETLVAEDVFAECPFACEQDDVIAGLALLRAWSESHRSGLSTNDFDELCGDYNRLFVGPHKVLAAPWESVYFSADRVLFQIQTLEVRNWYARFSLQIVNRNREPDDHLGLELEFIAHLARLALEAQAGNNGERFAQLLDAQRQFMQQHPLIWAPKCLNAIGQYSQTDFYRGIALLIAGALKEQSAVLNIQ